MTNRLGEMLGQDHDYTVLGETVCEHLMGGSAETSTPQPSVLLLEALIQFRQRQLRREAWSIGHQVLAEKPKALGKRWSAYWSAWHSRPPQAVTAKRVNRQDTLGAARPVTQDAEQAPSPDRSDRIAPKQ